MTPSAPLLVFVPGLGFISSDAKMLREPVTERIDDWEVTVDRVLVDRAGTRVAVTIYGPFRMVGDRYKQPDVKYDDFIQARDRNGIVSARRGDYFPAGGNGCAGDINAAPTGTATSAKFCFVGFIAVDSEGTVYAAQATRGKWIARIDPNGAVSTISNSFAVNGLAVDVNGDLLAGDADGHRVVRFPRADANQPVVVTSDLGTIVALAVGPEGSIYVAHWFTPTPTSRVTYRVTRLVPSP